MGFINEMLNFFRSDPLDEAIASFRFKGEDYLLNKRLKSTTGEGFEFYPMDAGISSFNMFYRNYIDIVHANEIAKIKHYRAISEMPEIADVIENAVIESTQENFDGEFLHLVVLDPKLEKEKTVVKILEDEFRNLFSKRLDLKTSLGDLFRTYFIDGRVYYERIVDRKNLKKGIIGIKVLPSETMDFKYNIMSGRIEQFYQYLKGVKPRNLEQAIEKKEVVVFNPEQIGFVDYGIYGKTKNEIIGYLEKVKVPYNQLKLLETSVIIYRLIRAPERFVFRIDVGNMPKDKAIKYVEKIKNTIQKRQSYDPSTGRLLQDPNVFSVLENFYLAQGADGRGSDVSTVGGQGTQGFTELSDIYYFQKKLYQALKYPMSRISPAQERREAEVMFMRSPVGEITRDEVQWATFLERQQTRFCNEFRDLFLLHLEFIGHKGEYNLSRESFAVKLNQPSYYRDRQQQFLLESKFTNYAALAGYPEMSKSYLMSTFLKWTDEEIELNSKGLQKDKKLGFAIQAEEQAY